MSIEEIRKVFIGRIVVSVDYDNNSDEGLHFIFDDGSQLKYGYSSCEGATFIDGKEIEILYLYSRGNQ